MFDDKLIFRDISTYGPEMIGSDDGCSTQDVLHPVTTGFQPWGTKPRPLKTACLVIIL
jgi:hypothetical protein